METKYIAYYRVSTYKQGLYGLGIDAQKKAVKDFVKCDTCIIAEYTEVESGKSDTRQELFKAIEQAKKEGATLVIAKLDRLSRNVRFISELMDSKVLFICCDMPQADNFTIHIIAAVAQQERKMISERTKSALKALKARGIKLGTPANLTAEGRAKGPEAMKQKAISNINNQRAKGYIKLLRDQDMTLQQIADKLNSEGFKTAMNKEFKSIQVSRILG